MSFDRLQGLIKTLKCPLIVGLDPRPAFLPPYLLQEERERYGQGPEADASAALRFHLSLIDALRGVVPAVHLRTEWYACLGWQGMKALEEITRYAREQGLFLLTDAGSLGVPLSPASLPVFDTDCLVVSGYLGSDALTPLLAACQERDKCLLVLAKTANPSTGELQELVAGDRLVYQVVGDLTQRLGKDDIGKLGYSRAGIVVEGVYPSDLRTLRKRWEQSFLLVSGSAGDVRFAFDKYGRGAAVAVTEPILAAWRQTGQAGRDFPVAARAAAESLRDELKQYITFL